MAWTLYYDGGCNLCHASKLRVERWAESRGFPLHVDILQSPEAMEKGYGDAMVLEIDGKPHFGADAWLETMRLAPWYLRWIGTVCRVPGIRQLASFGYGVVARFRYKLFGTRACPLPGSRPK